MEPGNDLILGDWNLVVNLLMLDVLRRDLLTESRHLLFVRRRDGDRHIDFLSRHLIANASFVDVLRLLSLDGRRTGGNCHHSEKSRTYAHCCSPSAIPGQVVARAVDALDASQRLFASQL